jgi:hypothetical protein
LLKVFSLEALFISAGDDMGINASNKMPFFNTKIVRCPSCGYYKNRDFFKKCFSNDDFGPYKNFVYFFYKRLANGL